MRTAHEECAKMMNTGNGVILSLVFLMNTGELGSVDIEDCYQDRTACHFTQMSQSVWDHVVCVLKVRLCFSGKLMRLV